MELTDKNGIYTAVKWNDDTCEFEVTIVSVENHKKYPHKLIIRDIENPSKQMMYSYYNNFEVDKPALRQWVYARDMTIDEVKDAILKCKQEQVDRYYASYMKHKNMLDIMTMKRNQ